MLRLWKWLMGGFFGPEINLPGADGTRTVLISSISEEYPPGSCYIKVEGVFHHMEMDGVIQHIKKYSDLLKETDPNMVTTAGLSEGPDTPSLAVPSSLR